MLLECIDSLSGAALVSAFLLELEAKVHDSSFLLLEIAECVSQLPLGLGLVSCGDVGIRLVQFVRLLLVLVAQLLDFRLVEVMLSS